MTSIETKSRRVSQNSERSSLYAISDMADSSLFPLLQKAHDAVLLLEDTPNLVHTSLRRTPAKSAPAPNEYTISPSPPITASPAKRNHRTCYKPSFEKERNDLEKTADRIRVDSAKLFSKLAEILPPGRNAATEEIDEIVSEELHRSVLSAVESCTTQKEPPELGYYVRKGLNSS